jgi:hypothetical protein
MVTHKRIRRLDYIDTQLAEGVLADSQARLAEYLAEPSKFPQRQWSSVARQHRFIWGRKYALGYPLSEVREAMRGEVDAYREVFRLRGTDPGFPVYMLKVLDPSLPPGEPGAVKLTEKDPPAHVDHTLTNSCRSYDVACRALILQDFDAAKELALGAWDPPDAKWVSPRSESCTPNDQNLSYGLREYFRGDLDAASAFLKRVRPFHGELRDTVDQAAMVRAIIENNGPEFLLALERLLAWHANEAPKGKNSRSSEYFLCLGALGLSALALRHGVITIPQLPPSNPFFPTEMLQGFAGAHS